MERMCKKCSSQSVLTLEEEAYLYKYKKSEGNRSEEGGIKILIEKILCEECGEVFEVVNQDSLKAYKEYKQYIVK